MITQRLTVRRVRWVCVNTSLAGAAQGGTEYVSKYRMYRVLSIVPYTQLVSWHPPPEVEDRKQILNYTSTNIKFAKQANFFSESILFVCKFPSGLILGVLREGNNGSTQNAT